MTIDRILSVVGITKDSKSKLRSGRSGHLMSTCKTSNSAGALILSDILEIIVSISVAVKIRLSGLDLNDIDITLVR